MQPIMPNSDNGLDQLWEPNREHVRRLLISLARDLDLAEDLAQETYLDARSGLGGYRGGDARAWLSAIARNAFYAHARRQSVRMEIPGEVDERAPSQSRNGSGEHLAAIELRKAISELSPILRTALILKHYGGFSYEEISERVGCPVGSARRRVCDAIGKLRRALSPMMEVAQMRCEQVRGARLIEYVYGGLSDDDARSVKAHLDGCESCKREARQLKELISGLDLVEGDFKLTEIHDIDEDGRSTVYEWCSMANDFGEVMETVWWTWGRETRMEYLVAQGEELHVEVSPLSAEQVLVEAKLPHPVLPGEHTDTMYMARSIARESAVVQVRKNRWAFNYHRTVNSEKEWMFVYAVRLPPGAKLATATPDPSEVRPSDCVTVIWRAMLPRVEMREDGTYPWQFECSMEIDWETEAPLQAKAKPLSPPIPNELMELSDRVLALPHLDARDQALQVYAEASKQSLPYCHVWFDLGIKLFGSGCYEEAREAFGRSIELPALRGVLHNNSVYLAHAWQGMMLDLLGKREEALRAYGRALADPGRCVSNMQVYKLRVDKPFMEERLKTPFERK